MMRSDLTARELQIGVAAALGSTKTRQIWRALVLSDNTVRHPLTTLWRSLKVPTVPKPSQPQCERRAVWTDEFLTIS